jgi:thiol-disulfide isomerase/thioredoxin
MVASILATAALAQNPGQLAHGFTLVNRNGQVVRMADFKGQAVILNAWATWCSFCIEEIPLFQRVHNEINVDETQVTFLLINLGEDFDLASRFLDEHVATTLLTLFDPTKEQLAEYPDVEFDSSQNLLTGNYRIRGMPTTFFIGADGLISSVKLGPITADEIEGHLSDLGVEWHP